MHGETIRDQLGSFMKKLNKDRLEKTLRERLQDQLEHNAINAAQILILQDGQQVCAICEGYRNWETKEPLRPDAMYRLASMTKPVTAVAALIAEDKGYFRITDKVEDYLPAFADMYIAKQVGEEIVPGEKCKTPLRIYHLLSHCNGILSDTPIGQQQLAVIPKDAHRSIATMTEYAAAQPLAFQPETYSAYSPFAAFDVVAKIIEDKSGMPYAEFVKQNIFEPLGIRDITYHPTESQWERLLMLTERIGHLTFLPLNFGRHTFEAYPLSYTCAGAGLAGSIADYAVFAEMLRNGGTYNGVRIFSSERLKEMTTPYVAPEIPGRDPTSSWGLGVRVVDQPEVLPIGSFGWSGAYGTHFWIDPVNKITAIYMRGNRGVDSGGGNAISKQFEADVMRCLEDEPSATSSGS